MLELKWNLQEQDVKGGVLDSDGTVQHQLLSYCENGDELSGSSATVGFTRRADTFS